MNGAGTKERHLIWKVSVKGPPGDTGPLCDGQVGSVDRADGGVQLDSGLNDPALGLLLALGSAPHLVSSRNFSSL
jgi:hypothetical protein